jgi:RNA polymerase sigma factor (sigma-70 family)
MGGSLPKHGGSLDEALAGLSRSIDDRDAWATLYVSLWPFVFASLYRLLKGRRELAEDAAQDVFLRLLTHSHKFDFGDLDRFRVQVWRTCRDTARTLYRRERRREEHERELPDSLSLVDEKQFGDDNVTDLLDSHLSGESLRQKLSAEEASLLAEILADRSLGEIAARMGVSYSAAGVRVHRLRAKLRNLHDDKDL